MKHIPYEMRLISSWSALEAVREAEALGGSSLASNACVLSRALYRNGKPVFASGREALEKLPPQTIACWIRAYDRLCRADNGNWQEKKEIMSRDVMGRLRWKVLRSFGVLPTDPQARAMTDGDFLYCVLHMILDGEERLEQLCPSCRKDLLEQRCAVCGAVQYGENPNFDESRFEELKKLGSSDMAHGDSEFAKSGGGSAPADPGIPAGQKDGGENHHTV